VAGGDGLSGKAIRRAGPFELVLANILAGPLLRLAPAMARAVAPRGRAVLSGLLTNQEAEVRAASAARGFTIESARRLDGWSILVLTRSSVGRGTRHRAGGESRCGGLRLDAPTSTPPPLSM
jgi:ribosomal protein L11 methyltransferase